MWARISRFEQPIERMDQDIAESQEFIRELTSQSPGSQGVYYLVDRETGRTMVITLWESEEAMRNSEDLADQIRQKSVDSVGGRVVSVEHYEVALKPTEVMAMRW